MAEVFGRIFGQETCTRFHFRHEEPAPSTTTHAQIAGRVLGNRIVPLMAITSHEWKCERVRVHSYDPAGGELAWTDHAATEVGQVATAALPPGVAWCIKKRTGFPGRKERGRWYWPGVYQGAHEDGLILASVRADFVNAIQDFDEPITDGGSDLIPLLCTHNDVGDIVTMKEIQSVEPTWVLRNMRKRQIGVGQ